MTNDLHDRHVGCACFVGETPQQVRLAHARFALNKDCCTSTIRSIVESLPKEITFGSAAYGDPRSSVHGHTVMLEVVFDCRQKSANSMITKPTAPSQSAVLLVRIVTHNE